jgi:hypothetical protein
LEVDLARLPPEILKASIKPGSVYYFQEESLKSTEKHYFVVINRNPHTDEIILLACASSQIKNTRRIRRNCPAETLVIITPEQYCGFSVNSIFDCNIIFRYRLEVIMSKYKNKELLVKPEMDSKLVDTLREGVLASNLIAPRYKSMLQD